MERKSNIIIIFAYLLLVLVFFALGFIIGNINHEKPVVSTAVPKSELMSVSLPAVIEEKLKYCVRLNGDELSLLRVTQDGEEMMYTVKISADMFPKEDIEALKAGVELDSINEAHSLIENFVS